MEDPVDRPEALRALDRPGPPRGVSVASLSSSSLLLLVLLLPSSLLPVSLPAMGHVLLGRAGGLILSSASASLCSESSSELLGLSLPLLVASSRRLNSPPAVGQVLLARALRFPLPPALASLALLELVSLSELLPSSLVASELLSSLGVLSASSLLSRLMWSL